MALRASRLTVRQIMGVEELAIELGSLTVLTGRNGSGKSTVIEAVKALMEGGHDATLIRNGAEEGEVVLVLEDGTEARKRITPTGSSLTVKHPEMGRIGRAQTWLDSLQDHLSFNPVDFLTCDDAKRIQYVLESAATQLNPADLQAAVGDLLTVPDEITAHPLKVIERVRKHLYDERTADNRTARDARSTVEQLTKSVPQGVQDPEAIEAEIADLTSRLSAVEEAQTQAADDAEARVRERHAAELATVDARIAEIMEQLNGAKLERQRLMSRLDLEVRQAASAAVAPLNEEYRQLNERVAALREAWKASTAAAAARANTLTMIAAHERKAEAAETRSDALSEAIEKLDALKGRVMEASPIRGLDIRDGVLFYRDVPWQRVNAAERVKVAMQLAKHRAKDFPLVCVDGLETLDETTFRAFVKNAPKSGLQWIVTRVVDGRPLTVETVP